MALRYCFVYGVFATLALLLSIFAQGITLPVEALKKLDDRTINLGRGGIQLGGAIITEAESKRLSDAAKGLSTNRKGLEETLRSGKLEDGIISRADIITACLISTSQGRRISILNAFVDLIAFSEIQRNDGVPVSKTTDYSSVPNEDGVLLDDYPFQNLRARSIGNMKVGVRIVDEEKATDSAYTSDLREVCDLHETPENAVIATGEERADRTGLTFNTTSLGETNPFARLPNHPGIVRTRYDTYEVVLQAIAVALLLLDLFILDDFQDKKIKFYHILGISLLVVATIITVVMGYFQVLNVLASESYAWESCGAYSPFRTLDNSSKNGVSYSVSCEWVVIKAESTGASYLIIIPSLLGALLLLVLVARFSFLRYRAHRISMNEELDEETKMVREREKGNDHYEHDHVGEESESSRSKGPLTSLVRRAFVSVAISILFCGSMAQQFPPRSLQLIGANLVANDEVLFLGSVASASPWRCAWESGRGPSNDTTSIAEVDDCFARWTPPTEDESTALLFNQAEIKFVRCSPPGKRCPFTGTRCKATDPSFDCKNSLKVPQPIKFLSKRTIDWVDRWCSFGSDTRRAFCRAKCIRSLARIGLRMLNREIRQKLGDERVNVHRLSEYTFPGCAGPPRDLSANNTRQSTRFEHFSVLGDNCINSRSLEHLARGRARRACRQKVREKRGLCTSTQRYGNERNCRKRLVDICTDALYLTTLTKSRFMRAADDWLASRCHQGGMTKFGSLKNWVANKEAVIGPGDRVAKVEGKPMIRPVRQGWVFKIIPFRF